MKTKNLLLYSLGLLLLFTFSCDIDENEGVPDEQSEYNDVLFINEILASNDGVNMDNDGAVNDYDDWYELYNSSSVAIDITGFQTYDSGTEGTPYTFGSATVPGNGFLLIWCDDEATGIHTNFKLSAGGDKIVLLDADGQLIDEEEFIAQTTDVSIGRNPDGGSEWESFQTPTPESSNTGDVPNTAPLITNVSRTPQSPSPADDVTVTANVTDDNSVATVELFYKIDDGTFSNTVMTATTNDYSGTISAQSDSVVVSYFIKAVDDESAISYSDTTSYTVLASAYQPPELYINEFMASNDAANADEYGEFEDWVEIYNASSEAVDIGGMYITDGLDSPTEYMIPTTNPDSTTIPASGFLLLYADKDSEQGILHAEIKLSGDGEQIGLYSTDATNNVPIDTLTYNPDDSNAIGFGIDTDKSCGRQPDGSNTWNIYETANISPGATNN